jgi:hypothetical protein
LTDCAYRHDTRPHDLAAHDNGAGSALSHATSESGSAQPQFVIQNKQQRRFWINRQGVVLAVHIQRDLSHQTVFPLLLSLPFVATLSDANHPGDPNSRSLSVGVALRL